MKNIYEECPVLENERWLLRFVKEEDSEDLLEVYGDKQALPFFNSDNCHEDNFSITTRKRRWTMRSVSGSNPMSENGLSD